MPPSWSAVSVCAAILRISSERLSPRATKNLTTISNNTGVDGLAGLLLENGQIKHHIGTYVGENKLLEQWCSTGTRRTGSRSAGDVLRAHSRAGAGIPAFFTPDRRRHHGREGKETREFDGRTYVMERALKADSPSSKRGRANLGNLVYRKTARNFNPMMATAAENRHSPKSNTWYSPVNSDPDIVHTPSVYVKRIFQGKVFEKRIEKRQYGKRDRQPMNRCRGSKSRSILALTLKR